MTSTDLVPVAERDTFGTLAPATHLAETLARTNFVPSAYRGKPAELAACILFGHELGIQPMNAMQKIHVVDGRPGLAAEAMRALVLNAGHEIVIETSSSTRAKVKGRRRGSEEWTSVEWTMDDAKRAGLEKKDNWRKYPADMLVARASARLCRFIFADVLGGLSYSLEELEDGFIEVEATEASDGDAPATQTRTAPAPRKAPAKKAAARKAAAPKPAPAPPAPGDAPPLPGEEGFDDIVDAELVEDDPPADEKPVEVRRAQMLVIKAREAGLDDDARHAVVSMVTGGRTESTKDVTSVETDMLVEIFERFTAGDEIAALVAEVMGGDPPDDDTVEDEPPGDGARPVDVDGWREAMKAGGIRNAQVLRWASEDAGALNREPPTNLAALLEDGELADLVWMRIADRSDG